MLVEKFELILLTQGQCLSSLIAETDVQGSLGLADLGFDLNAFLGY